MPERSAPALLTLPGVAELLSSRPSSADSIPAQHQLHHPSNRPRFTAAAPPPSDHSYSRSSPPHQPSFKSNSAAPAGSEPQFQSTANPASQPSPIIAHTSTTPLDEHYYYHPTAQPAQPNQPTAFSPSNAEAPQYSHDTLPPQPPINARRQDSAISQRNDSGKDDHSAVPPPDHLRYHSHQSPRDGRNSVSPTLNSQSTSPTSTHSSGLAAHPPPHPNHPHFQAAGYPVQRGHAKSASTDHFSTDASRHYELGTAVATPISSAHQETQTNYANPNTRQQRYNVRFAANHTPDNMPSFPKPRNDHPPTPTTTAEASTEASTEAGTEASTDANEHPKSPKEQDAPRNTFEPAIQLINKVSNTDDAPQTQSRKRESSVERCAGCGETWSRPLPESFSNLQSSSTGKGKESEFARHTLDMVTRLNQHSKLADDKFGEWKIKHSFCVHHRDLSPYYAANNLHSAAANGTSSEYGQVHSATQKRKADHLVGHEQNGSSKQRKVAPESIASSSAPSQPSKSP